MKRLFSIYILISLIGVLSVLGKTPEVRLFGYVLDSDNRGIELANVYVEGTTNGTTTNKNGYYDLTVEMGDTIIMVYSMIGYETIRQQLYTQNQVLGVNVVLPTNEEMLSEITVRGIQRQTSTMDRADVGVARLMPDATGGGIESLLITFAGVRQNNEMSSQYNVRGGSYDENSVYVNGLEVHRPLLIRSGQQEGLSFVNADMVESVDFSAGGFDAMYGDKMSSVLDIRYKRPTQLESHLNISILGASAYLGWGDSLQSQMHGIRYKTSKYMLGALDTKGNYKPNFVDYQTQMTWKVGKKATRRLGDRQGKLPKDLVDLGGNRLTQKNLSGDHGVPRSKGGKTVDSNMLLATKQFNSLRGDRPLKEVTTMENLIKWTRQYLALDKIEGFDFKKYVLDILKILEE